MLILIYLNFTKKFILCTDASTVALGAILAQLNNDGKKHVKTEQNYSVTELECLTVIWMIKHYHHFLHELFFTLITNHAMLCYLFNIANLIRRLARWIMWLQDYKFIVKYRLGKSHT